MHAGMAILSCSVMFSSGERCVFYAVGLSFLRVLMLGCSFLRLRVLFSKAQIHRLLIITPFLDFRFLVMLL